MRDKEGRNVRDKTRQRRRGEKINNDILNPHLTSTVTPLVISLRNTPSQSVGGVGGVGGDGTSVIPLVIIPFLEPKAPPPYNTSTPTLWTPHFPAYKHFLGRIHFLVFSRPSFVHSLALLQTYTYMHQQMDGKVSQNGAGKPEIMATINPSKQRNFRTFLW